MINHIHSLSDVQATKIGLNTFVWQFTVILKEAVIGDNCNINCNCFIENKVIIGNNVTIKSGVQIWDGITIEDNVFVGPNVTFTNDLVPRSKVYPLAFEKTLLKRGCSIGANSTLVAGIQIGEYAFVGVGSVVTKSIKPYELWYGNPAKHKGFITADQVILNLDLMDEKTKNMYYLDNYKPILL